MLIALLQSDTFVTCKVRFKHTDGQLSAKEYSYKAPITMGLEIGDEAVVNSPSKGMVVVMVTQVDDCANLDLRAGFSYKWIVQKVQVVEYLQRMAVEGAAERELRKAATLVAKKKAMDECWEALEGNSQAMKIMEEVVSSLTASDPEAGLYGGGSIPAAQDSVVYPTPPSFNK